MMLYRLTILALLMICVQTLRTQFAAADEVIVISPANSRGTPISVRVQVDPQNSIERFLFLAPGAPLVVEAAMTIDGRPFRERREALIGEMMAAADQDNDGQPTWQEALNSAQFTLGRYRPTNRQQVQQYITTFDKNENTLVDREEVRGYLARNFQGAAFALIQSTGTTGQLNVRKLLDANKDDILTTDEIAAATQQLRRRDYDENDLLYAAELSNESANPQQAQTFRKQPLALMLGPTADASSLFEAVTLQYADDEGDVTTRCFPVLAELFDQLDKNSDGRLEQNEMLGFNDVEPHVRIEVRLGTRDRGKAISRTSIAKELKRGSPVSGEGSISVDSPRFKATFSADEAPPRTINYESIANRYMQLNDKDKNGYLDENEMTGSIARNYDAWDANGDGNVYVDEIIASYGRSRAPQRGQILASVATQGDILFQALDETGDQRLSLRELRKAQQCLTAFDSNKDGRITLEEVPITLSVHFATGDSNIRFRFIQATSTNAAASEGPPWFVRMDRNSDGDLTLDEFLGSTAQFNELDTNSDAFIELQEAVDAGS